LIEKTGEDETEPRLGKPPAMGLVLGVVLFGLSGCFTGPPRQTTSFLLPEGDPQQGWYAVQEHGCHSCHTIPGVPGADTHVGPPLTDWARRRYIAGSLVNVPENLIRWIQYPQEVEPGTAMPNIPMTEVDARNIAAFLYTLGYD
jgi:cytochrome c2